ncbi:MAG: hypothetical protein WKG07_28160 [Hymenobacter sp.]
MKVSFRPALALLLGSVATLLTACDYSYSPGKNPQTSPGFSNPRGYTSADINADSINNRQIVTTPIGKGSATDLKNGTVDDQLNSAPAGTNTTSPQTASGKMGSVDQNMTPPKSPGSSKNSGPDNK